MAWLQPLDADNIRVDAWDAWTATALPGVPDAVRLNTVAGRPAYHFRADGKLASAWADTGQPLRVTPAVVAGAASDAVADVGVVEMASIELDQWTFGPLKVHRPLQKVVMDDEAGSVLYVSGRTGELVRDTTRSERAWNWAGSVIHWIYFTPLRTHGEPWRQVVMWTSGVAFALALSGMVLGIQRLRLKRRYAGGRRSPYRGSAAWHHWLGLTAGTVTLTWLFSGWLSVTPFDWLASPGITAQDRLAFAGGPLDRADLSVPVAHLLGSEKHMLELEWRRVGGRLYLGALGREGRSLLDARTGVSVGVLAQDALVRAVQAMRPGIPLQAEMLTTADGYYYSHHRDAKFPVLRARFDLPDATTFYVDPASGQLVGHADRNSMWNRWLFNAVHQFDFAQVIRTRPVWDVTVIALLLAGSTLTVTGLVLGWRRLRKG